MSTIHVTIDRLVLGGLDSAGRAAFVKGLRSELERMLADPTTRTSWARPRRTPVLRLARLGLEPGASGARRLGTQVARGIGGGLKP